MSYIDNPYNSDVGKSLLKKNLTNIFLVGDKPNSLESKSKETMVSNFRQQTNTIITIMKRFVKGYKQISLGNSYDSGIYVCPNEKCGRRDFIYHWESVDLGLYNPKDWLGTVKPSKVNSGIPNYGKGNYMIMHRVRCNTVTTCNKCHITYQGKVTDCPNVACNGGSEYMKTVGCGEEACAIHYVKEKTLLQEYPTNELTAGRGQTYNRAVTTFRHGLVRETRGEDLAFEIVPPSMRTPMSGLPQDLESITSYTPVFRMTYGAEKRTKVVNYPLSLYRYGFTRINRRFCMGLPDGRGGTMHQNTRYDGRVWLTDMSGRETAACPQCGGMEPPTVLESKQLLQPRPLVIENPQPLSQADVLARHEEQVMWQMYLSDPGDSRERSNFLVPVAQAWNLQKIPTEVTSKETGVGHLACPNDVGFQQGVNDMKDAEGDKSESIVDYLALPRARVITIKGIYEDDYKKAKKDNAIPTIFAKKPEGYVVCVKSESGDTVTVSGIEVAENGKVGWTLKLEKKQLDYFSKGLGESGPNFTYAVCEGRSNAAFKWQGKWVDCSQPCVSYRSQDGKTLKRPRQYPRFNQYPEWYLEGYESQEWKRVKNNLIRDAPSPDPAGLQVGESYLWMDELSHLIMDPLRYGPIVEGAVSNLMSYHTVNTISEEINLDIGSKTVILECQTCKKAYQAGGIEKSRQAEGFVNSNGETTAPFLYPQDVFDLEMEYQKEWGMNILDKPIAWGVVADTNHNGKKMLSNPTQIRID